MIIFTNVQCQTSVQQDKQSEAIGLVCLSSLLVIIYLAWLVLTIRYHCQVMLSHGSWFYFKILLTQVWFKWRSNNQDIRLLNVSGQRPRAERSRVDQRQTGQLVRQSMEVFEDVEIVVTRAVSQSSLSSLSSHHSGDKSLPAQHPSGHNISHLAGTNQFANISLPVEEAVDKITETKIPEDKVSKPSHLFPPLSPYIISHDPQEQSHSKVVHFTEDSEIYAQLPDISCPPAVSEDFLANCSPSFTQACKNATQSQDHQLSIHSRAVSVPYLPDLKRIILLLSGLDKNHSICRSSREELFLPISDLEMSDFLPRRSSP